MKTVVAILLAVILHLDTGRSKLPLPRQTFCSTKLEAKRLLDLRGNLLLLKLVQQYFGIASRDVSPFLVGDPRSERVLFDTFEFGPIALQSADARICWTSHDLLPLLEGCQVA